MIEIDKSKVDWIIHCVTEDKKCDICGKEANENNESLFPYFCNFHTHGLDYHGYPELVVSLLIGNTETIAGLINCIAYMILYERRKPLKAGKKYLDFLQNGYEIKIYQPENCPVQFIFFPDKNNKFPEEEGCDEWYNRQKEYADIIIKDKGYV